MTRQSLDLGAHGWTRIGRGSLRKTALIVLAISAVVAIFITAPMSRFGPLLFGTSLPLVVAYLASVIVVFSLIAPLMLPRATRPLYVDSTNSRIRVGLRSMPIDELHHAYRVPDPQADGRFQLKLGVRGLDALIGISAKSAAELSDGEMDALIALIERAPIEPDPALPLRPPVGGELGKRTDAEDFDDALTHVLLPYETTTFAKATLLRELRAIRGGLTRRGMDEADVIIRDLGLVAPGTTNAPERQAAIAKEAARSSGPARGFWALQGSRHRSALAEAESWLSAESGGRFTPRRGWRWGAGLAIIVVGLVSPWVAFSVVVSNIVLFNDDSGAFVGPISFFILAWPFIVWAGFMLMWQSRIARFDRARRAALEVRRGGTEVPDEIGRASCRERVYGTV